MSKNEEQAAVTITAWVVMLSVLCSLAACGKKEEKPPELAAAASAPAVPQPTQVEMVAAVLRGHPNSRQVCVDGERDRAFFLDYGPLQKPGAEPDNQYHGWIFIEKIDFYKTSNNTWFITDQDDKKYAQVYPDVTGLFCRPH